MNRRKRYFRRQKLMGLGMVVLSIVFMMALLAIGETDGTILLFGVPMGLYLIFTKKMVLDDNYKLEMEEKEARS